MLLDIFPPNPDDFRYQTLWNLLQHAHFLALLTMILRYAIIVGEEALPPGWGLLAHVLVTNHADEKLKGEAAASLTSAIESLNCKPMSTPTPGNPHAAIEVSFIGTKNQEMAVEGHSVSSNSGTAILTCIPGKGCEGTGSGFIKTTESQNILYNGNEERCSWTGGGGFSFTASGYFDPKSGGSFGISDVSPNVSFPHGDSGNSAGCWLLGNAPNNAFCGGGHVDASGTGKNDDPVYGITCVISMSVVG